jgi:queuine/archaeosine tRNA-ribosyltransferase
MQRQEQTLCEQLCDGLQGNESCDANSHARALPRSYISQLKQREVTFRTALVHIHNIWRAHGSVAG